MSVKVKSRQSHKPGTASPAGSPAQAAAAHTPASQRQSATAPPEKAAPATVARDSASSNWHNLDNRLSMIAEAAYFKAEKRDFEIGHEVADWLEAEQELAEIMGEA